MVERNLDAVVIDGVLDVLEDTPYGISWKDADIQYRMGGCGYFVRVVS